MLTKHYYVKRIVRLFVNDKHYHYIKGYKLLFEFLIGKDDDQVYSFICKILPPKSIIIDIGANMGTISWRLARNFPNSIIYSIEPLNINFRFLLKSISLLNFKNIVPLNYAISLHEGYEEMKIPKIKNLIISTRARLSFQKTNSENFSEYIYERVKTIKLDSLVNKLNLKSLEFLKVDTEGFDDIVLYSGKNTIEKYKPIIRLEADSRSSDFDWLRKMGYKTFYLNNENRLINSIICGNNSGDNFLIHENHFERLKCCIDEIDS